MCPTDGLLYNKGMAVRHPFVMDAFAATPDFTYFSSWCITIGMCKKTVFNDSSSASGN